MLERHCDLCHAKMDRSVSVRVNNRPTVLITEQDIVTEECKTIDVCLECSKALQRTIDERKRCNCD